MTPHAPDSLPAEHPHGLRRFIVVGSDGPEVVDPRLFDDNAQPPVEDRGACLQIAWAGSWSG